MKGAMTIKFLIFQYLSFKRLSEDFDFFYFVQSWPGSYCDTKRSCCYPTSGKPPSDFSIHGLWPTYNSGKWPQDCDPESAFDKTQISDLLNSMEEKWATLACPSNDGTKFWKHEWEKHGTCSESQLDQHSYFEAALKLKEKANLLQILLDKGIVPDDGFYDYEEIRSAITEAVGVTPILECNKDPFKNCQLYQIYLCVDTTGTDFIECPKTQNRGCQSTVQFPKF